MEKGVVQCGLCPRRCRVSNGKRGYCEVRENREGEYLSLVYGNPAAIHLDPIEKKPFFHVLPASGSFSLATAGCNLHCKFCQNWEISQARPEEIYSYEVPPDMVVRQARAMGARSVAYTYTEPTVFYEFMVDTARLVAEAGLLNVMHSNGFINPAPLEELCPLLDAANIDLKGFSESFYRELCEGEQAPVLESLKILKRKRVHLEITNLLIPTRNDDMAMIRGMSRWIRVELGADTPLHLTRFYPLYKLKSLPPTPVYTLVQARAAALAEGLQYVYIGNVPGHEGANTFCPHCGRMIIQRAGFMVVENKVQRGTCAYCGAPIAGIWE
ncbi:MAG: AmmeMemoRadiSam system radical SAM enzyme [Spirochaetaceae bacterium]|nr:MAG: AmmeMemoRadiSam system radical SAM enzyme [Spirochaetaceae bacterium]